MQETQTRVQSLGWKDLLEEEMAPHSSFLTWAVPWTEEPGGLQPMGLQSQMRRSTHAPVYKTIGKIADGELTCVFHPDTFCQ